MPPFPAAAREARRNSAQARCARNGTATGVAPSGRLGSGQRWSEACSPGPYLELFARGPRANWTVWGNQADEYEPTWKTYGHHSAAEPNSARQPSLFGAD